MSHKMPVCLIRNGDPLGMRGDVLITPEGRSLARITKRDGSTLTIRDFYWCERLWYRIADSLYSGLEALRNHFA